MPDSHHSDPTTASTDPVEATGDGRRFIPPVTGRWPAHWRVPTPADLEALEAGYRCGLVPAHLRLLHDRMPALVVGSVDAKQVAERLYEAARQEVNAAGGQMVGLAAPQVGILARACLFDPRQDPPPEALPVEQLRCVINPTVEALGHDLIREVEGCLNLGPIKGWVQRAARVRLRGHTPDGEPIEEEHTGLAARVIQHETDHLNGIVFPQRIGDDYDLPWASAEQVKQFTEYARAHRRGEKPPGTPALPATNGTPSETGWRSSAASPTQMTMPTRRPGRDRYAIGRNQTTPLRHGYTMADLAELTRRAALGSRWRSIDFDERADVARFAIVEHLLTATEPPGSGSCRRVLGAGERR